MSRTKLMLKRRCIKFIYFGPCATQVGGPRKIIKSGMSGAWSSLLLVCQNNVNSFGHSCTVSGGGPASPRQSTPALRHFVVGVGIISDSKFPGVILVLLVLTLRCVVMIVEALGTACARPDVRPNLFVTREMRREQSLVVLVKTCDLRVRNNNRMAHAVFVARAQTKIHAT